MLVAERSVAGKGGVVGASGQRLEEAMFFAHSILANPSVTRRLSKGKRGYFDALRAQQISPYAAAQGRSGDSIAAWCGGEDGRGLCFPTHKANYAS